MSRGGGRAAERPEVRAAAFEGSGKAGGGAAAGDAGANNCRSQPGGFESFGGGSSYGGAGGYTQSAGGFGSPTLSQAEKKSVRGVTAPSLRERVFVGEGGTLELVPDLSVI